MPEVIAFGDVNMDIIAQFASFPTQGKDAFADSAEFRCGGSAANTAMALARMGFETALSARLGSDRWAELALQSLREAGVMLGNLQRDPTAMTGLMYIIVTPDGERTILGHRGANVFTDPNQIRKEDFLGARLFLLSGYALLTEPQHSAALLALEMAHRQGLTVTLDPGMSGCGAAVDDIRSCLPMVNILLPNLAEAQQLAGVTGPEECAQALLGTGVQVVVIKLGAAGCLVGNGDGFLQVPGFAVQARDSTGAGDSFAAGLIAGFLQGLDWTSTAILGNAMGALAAASMRAGTNSQMPRQVLALLGKHYDLPPHRGHQQAIDKVIEFVKLVTTES